MSLFMSITVSIDTLQSALKHVLGERIQKIELALGELTLTVKDADYASVALQLRDHPDHRLPIERKAEA